MNDGNGGHVSIKSYVDEIFRVRAEADVARTVSLVESVKEAKTTAEKAIREAKVSADRERGEVVTRLDKLESGGAPYALRLDDNHKKLISDVEDLKSKAVAEGALEDAKKQIRNNRVTALFSLVVGVVLMIVEIVARV